MLTRFDCVSWDEGPGGIKTDFHISEMNNWCVVMLFTKNIGKKEKSEVTQSCPTLCDPVDCSPPGSFVHGIFQARTLEWVAIPFSRGSSWPRDWTCASYIGRQILYHWAIWEAHILSGGALVAKSCPTRATPRTVCSPLGSSVHGIFQARILE